MRAVRIAALVFLLMLCGSLEASERREASTGAERGTASQPSTRSEATPSASKPKASEPPLDLALLEKRLKETEAIGLFTKLTLKNEVDDLLERFRAYYEGRSDTPPATLRQPYEMLILKVLTLLQDDDPSLAKAIADSREAIWGILTDREKFAKL